MYDPNRDRNQLPAPVTTGTGQYTAGTPIAPRTAQGSVPVGPSRVDFSSTPALQKLFQPAPPSTGYTQSNVNANRNANVKAAGLVAPPITPTQPPPSQGGLPPPNLPLRKGEGQGGGELVRAAEAQTPFVAPALAAPASFTDPAGNARSFADPRSAATAQGTLESPAGQEKLRGEILNRTFDVTATAGQPGSVTPQELAFALPRAPGPAQLVSLAAPALPPPTPPSQGGGLTSSSSPPSEGGAGGGPVDVIRGTKVSSAGGGDQRGGSALEFANRALLEDMQAAEEMGGEVYHLGDKLKTLEGLAGVEKATAGGRSTLPSLSQVQGQRLLELSQNPDGITEADRLVFGKGGAAAAPKLYRKPTYNDDGFQTGETPYLYDAEGNLRELKLPGADAGGAQQGSAGQAPAAAIDKLKKNPKLAAAFRQKYGYLPEGF